MQFLPENLKRAEHLRKWEGNVQGILTKHVNLLCLSTVNGKTDLTDSNRAEPYVTPGSYLVADPEERRCNAMYFDRSPPTFQRKVSNPSVCSLLISDLLPGLLLDSDDGSDIFLRNIGGHYPTTRLYDQQSSSCWNCNR